MPVVITSARQLLREIDPLPFPDRQRLLARTARELVGSAELGLLLEELSGADQFSRRLALQIASIAGQHEYIGAVLRERDPALVSRAIKAAVRHGSSGDAIAGVLPELPSALRHTLYQAIRRRGATDLAERFLPSVRARWGEHEAAALLGACSAQTVIAQLPELEHAIANWVALARRHPRVVLDFVDAQLGALPRAGWSGLWQRVGAGVAAMAEREPDRVLDLLERSLPHVALPTALARSMAALARHDRQRVLHLVLDPRRQGGVPGGRTFWRAFADAADADLVALSRAIATDRWQFQRFLHTLPPRRRAAVYDGLLGAHDLVANGIDISVLDELPATQRHAEAARLLTKPSVTDDPHLRLQVTARLDWAAAAPVLTAATRRATADERAEAYPLYVTCAVGTRDSEVVGAMLASLARLANEQDPVRSAAVSAIASIPPWLFREADSDVLAKLMRDAAQARDRSWRTETAINDLARALLREGVLSRRPLLVSAGLDGMQLLGSHQSWLNLYGLDRDLPRGAEQGVFAALQPRLDADARRGRYAVALALAGGLGRRAWDMPALQRFVDTARSAKDDGVVHTAIGLWLAPPNTRDERVAQILRADRSTITIPVVQSAIAWRRTDLLDDVFRRPLHGRFLKRGVRYVPTFRGCFDAWLPRQVSTYADLLLSLATGPRVPVRERVAAVSSLGRVPGTRDTVRGFLGDTAVPVVEAALAALAWSDDPATALPELLSYADDDRARVAIYAAARCAGFVAPGELGGMLRPLLASAKVTSRKEAVRLVAEHRVTDAAALLSQTWSVTDQHRDVRRSIVSASRSLLDDERSWQLLAEAAADHDVATALLDITPTAIAECHRTRYAALVLGAADAADDDAARLGLAALPRWARWTGATGVAMLTERVVDLASTATWRDALDALLATCDLLEDGGPLTEVTAILIAALDQAIEGRDQPARQRATRLAVRLRAQLDRSAALRPAALTVADQLVPVAGRVGVELAASAVPWATGELDVLRHVAQLADRAVLAHHAHVAVQEGLRRVLPRLTPGRVLDTATALARDESPAASVLALGICQLAGSDAGWSAPWRTLLGELRDSDDPDVRALAFETFTDLG
ncbi:MAG: hypothetical protein DLM58_20945 [Pseudonocardiales bacterium]|nr:MAG: hypothetical protein DLM58_20945 [Pseudonocardiales bacterium]